MAWTTPRTWTPGETASANLLNTHLRDNLNVLKGSVFDDGTPVGASKYARSTSDFTKNNSQTLSDVTGLSFSIGANETWAFTFYLYGTSTTTADMQIAVTFPASPTQVQYAVHTHDASIGTAKSTRTAGAAISWNVAGVEEGWLVTGIVRNGANAGNVQLQMAQATATAVNTTIRADSYVLAQRVV
jgi:hypothetical protein